MYESVECLGGESSGCFAESIEDALDVADILMNEIVFNEVRLIYFKGETEEHDEFEIDRDDEKDM